ncbi:MAG: peptidylprolyl isomerase [Erythrobacter sp.]|nr:MAG: peptidylprolyl isomerase [Erythrobacter sp.]
MRIFALAALPLLLALPATAQEAPAPVTPSSVIAAAAPEEWVRIAAEDLLVMELAPDAAGQPRTVVIQLIPPPFSQPWVENIRTLARAHWWDETSVNRVQDNYVTQWGDATEAKPLPDSLMDTQGRPFIADFEDLDRPLVEENLENAYEGMADHRIAWLDGYSGFPRTGYYADVEVWVDGWPIASDNELNVWPIHCYGYVGVGRNYAPDTGTGAELYTIIGQPQRHMDRNLAVVGRVIAGMQHLSSLPRGSGELGFYTEEEAHLRTSIMSVRLGSELPAPPAFEYLDTSSQSFAQLVQVRANRNDEFYTVSAGGVDICSVEVPIRRVHP